LRVLVTGGSNTPGYKIAQEFARTGYKVVAQYNEHEIPEIDGIERVRVDFRESSKIIELVNNIKPDIIIHTAAIGDVDKCEIEKELAWKVNVEATLTFAKEFSKFNMFLLIFIHRLCF